MIRNMNTGPRPTTITIHPGDARELDWLPSESIHLALTSPPYWTLKEYPLNAGQLGSIATYEDFHDELDKVWRHCFRALVPGGRLVCVVGDVCLSRRKHGRHSVIPLGTATTLVAAARCARNAFGVEIEASYIDYAIQRLERRTSSLFGDQPELVISDAAHKARKCG